MKKTFLIPVYFFALLAVLMFWNWSPQSSLAVSHIDGGAAPATGGGVGVGGGGGAAPTPATGGGVVGEAAPAIKGAGQKTIGGGTYELPNPLGAKTFGEFITKLMKALEPIILVLAVFFIILAGFQFVTAQGNEEKIKKAKQTLYWTLIGTAIALGADILIRVIQDILKTL